MWKERYPKNHQPTLQEVEQFIQVPYYASFLLWIYQQFQAQPILQYSNCSMQAGWNLKLKRGSKNYATVYPMKKYFIVLVTLKAEWKQQIEKCLEKQDPSILELYQKTPYTNGSKWLMIEVKNEAICEGVKELLKIKYQV